MRLLKLDSFVFRDLPERTVSISPKPCRTPPPKSFSTQQGAFLDYVQSNPSTQPVGFVFLILLIVTVQKVVFP
jgi:hypothetical protein